MYCGKNEEKNERVADTIKSLKKVQVFGLAP
jgi:hypothetical protein